VKSAYHNRRHIPPREHATDWAAANKGGLRDNLIPLEDKETRHHSPPPPTGHAHRPEIHGNKGERGSLVVTTSERLSERDRRSGDRRQSFKTRSIKYQEFRRTAASPRVIGAGNSPFYVNCWKIGVVLPTFQGITSDSEKKKARASCKRVATIVCCAQHPLGVSYVNFPLKNNRFFFAQKIGDLHIRTRRSGNASAVVPAPLPSAPRASPCVMHGKFLGRRRGRKGLVWRSIPTKTIIACLARD